LKSRGIRKKDKITVINELRHKYKLTDLLAYASIPRSTYYFHNKQSKKNDKYSDIKNEIQNIYHENK